MSAHQNGIAVTPDTADPEGTAKAKRRSFSVVYKTKILAEVQASAGRGNIGEILRREGIHSSTLNGWRKERDASIHSGFPQNKWPAHTDSANGSSIWNGLTSL